MGIIVVRYIAGDVLAVQAQYEATFEDFGA